MAQQEGATEMNGNGSEGEGEAGKPKAFSDRRITVLCVGTALMDFTSHIASQVRHARTALGVKWRLQRRQESLVACGGTTSRGSLGRARGEALHCSLAIHRRHAGRVS